MPMFTAVRVNMPILTSSPLAPMARRVARAITRTSQTNSEKLGSGVSGTYFRIARVYENRCQIRLTPISIFAFRLFQQVQRLNRIGSTCVIREIDVLEELRRT